MCVCNTFLTKCLCRFQTTAKVNILLLLLLNIIYGIQYTHTHTHGYYVVTVRHQRAKFCWCYCSFMLPLKHNAKIIGDAIIIIIQYLINGSCVWYVDFYQRIILCSLLFGTLCVFFIFVLFS